MKMRNLIMFLVGFGMLVLVFRLGVNYGRKRLSSSQADRIMQSIECGKGDDEACRSLFATNQERCEKGDTQGCVLIGIAYQAGKQVAKNDIAAVPYFQKACDAGDSNGCWYLGTCYEYGRGTAQDIKKARQWYRHGCEMGGDVNACKSADRMR